jgi:hypothetical protein
MPMMPALVAIKHMVPPASDVRLENGIDNLVGDIGRDTGNRVRAPVRTSSWDSWRRERPGYAGKRTSTATIIKIRARGTLFYRPLGLLGQGTWFYAV